MAVARILGAKGLAGAVRVELLTDWPERLKPGAELWLEGDAAPIRILRMETGGRTPVLHLDRFTTREAAEALSDRYLEAPIQELPAETYYWDDLVGLRVEEPDGMPVGELVEIFRAGDNEVYRIVGERGERLVPALRTSVLRIDLAAGLMVVAPDDAEEVR
ncbi:MAG TPA: ribosome maturation factor RimM [Candidatus Limnocylindrales bacterium]|nr:ribosome maturation factor RimM [Candidatus Limnocylindrales bacterium]